MGASPVGQSAGGVTAWHPEAWKKAEGSPGIFQMLEI